MTKCYTGDKISVLLDTSVIVAYYNSNDQHHDKASKLFPEIFAGKFGRPIISDYIFDETVTVSLLRLKNKEVVRKIGSDILFLDMIFLKVTERIFMEAWKIFAAVKQNFSFTDCTSLALWSTLKIDYIATFDEEFKKLKMAKILP